MAIRPVFVSKMDREFVEQKLIEFKWYAGFAVTQKQKSISELHENFLRGQKESLKVLEVSSKSTELLGVSLSAFNLQIEKVKSKQRFSVECAFQASKVFEKGGPYIDILEKNSREAKKDERLKTSGKLVNFTYSGKVWSLEPKTMFYDWLYINALSLEINKDLATQVVEYDAFTDIEFNPDKSINCQARAVALYVSLYRQNLLDYALEDPRNYVRLMIDKDEQFEQIGIF